MAVDYGTDLNMPDLDFSETGDMASGQTLMRQAAVIRLSTGRSVLDAPDDGIDLNDLLSRANTPASIASLASTIEHEMLKDERFLTAKADVSFSNETLIVNLALETALGPFTLVLSGSEAGLLILGGQ